MYDIILDILGSYPCISINPRMQWDENIFRFKFKLIFDSSHHDDIIEAAYIDGLL